MSMWYKNTIGPAQIAAAVRHMQKSKHSDEINWCKNDDKHLEMLIVFEKELRCGRIDRINLNTK